MQGMTLPDYENLLIQNLSPYEARVYDILRCNPDASDDYIEYTMSTLARHRKTRHKHE